MLPMTYGQEVVQLCTRDGHTAWQAVSNILGCSVDQAKALYGPLEFKEPEEDETPSRPPVRRR